MEKNPKGSGRKNKENAMKKLLTLALVLGVASMANAMILTIDGVPAPDEITLMPSDWINLDLHLTPGEGTLAFDVMFVLNNNQARFLTPEWVPPQGYYPGYWTNITTVSPDPFDSMPIMPFGQVDSQHVRIGGSKLAMPPVFHTGTAPNPDFPQIDYVIKDLMLHCEEATDVILDVIVADAAGMKAFYQGAEIEYQTGQVLDSISIIQIPEPMTMTLLGLGGLALIRRRRA